MVGWSVVGKKCGQMWKLIKAMCKTKMTEPELIVQLRLLIVMGNGQQLDGSCDILKHFLVNCKISKYGYYLICYIYSYSSKQVIIKSNVVG